MLSFGMISNIAYLDLSTPRRPHHKASHIQLADLKPGQHYVHDHSDYRTPFTVWIAQLRQRLGKKFVAEKKKSSRHAYVISVEATAKAAA